MSESWVVDEPQVIELDDVRSVRAAIIGGRVDLVGRDAPGARVEIHRVVGRPLEVSLDGGELRVGYATTLSGWDGFLERFLNFRATDTVEVHIAVHRDVRTKLATVSGEGLLAGVFGEAAVSTVSGGVVTDGTRGTLVAKAVSGNLDLRDHGGGLRASSVSGTLTASGSFEHVTASSVSGSVTLDADQLDGAALKTVSGDVTVRVPADLGLDVSARTVSGHVVADGQSGGGRPGRGPVDVRTGAGGCRVQVNTVSGHVTLLRAAEVDGPTGVV